LIIQIVGKNVSTSGELYVGIREECGRLAGMGRKMSIGYDRAIKCLDNKKAVSCDTAFSEFGSSCWARTSDLRINSPSLYQLS
tara:strand:+ start:610 stop:858 length:249 start_codon:yes stop_codon:yes gene_type:complete